MARELHDEVGQTLL
ncbi:hypothetical protein FY122_09215 [Dictyoglomus thermophilum]|uniref:Uncharacterized protein n=1 Tax=Dictyoglomus thermophilum TaxID=14 RepID=A0A7V4DY49_DICTH|nr:hypothetical protein FY122_09215 [Dictyoglomus thermophilum]